MSSLASILVSVSVVAAGAGELPRGESLVEHPRFRIEVARNVITDVPVKKIVIRAYDANGNPDPSYNEQPLITGIRLSLPHSDDAKLGQFKNGVLELTTDLNAGRKVYVSAPEVVVDAGERRSARMEVHRTLRWLSLAPWAIAFLLCLWPRNFVLAMFIAVISGEAILGGGNLFSAFVQTIDSFVPSDVSQAAGSEEGHFTMLMVLLLFGSLFAVIGASGGLSALTNRFGRYAKTRESAQLLVLIFGMLAFLDDFAHALLIGKTLRPLSDRLKISREKLAFLVDSTAAPMAAVAFVSTWLAAERGTIRQSFAALGLKGSPTMTLLASLPYCFYPILMLLFAALVVFVERDFGSMLRAEWRALVHNQLNRPNLADPLVLPVDTEPAIERKLARNAWLPLILLAVLIGGGLWWTGRGDAAASGSVASGSAASAPGASPTAASGSISAAASSSAATDAVGKTAADSEPSWLDALEHARPMRVLLFSAFIASAAAIALSVWFRSLTLQEGLHAWVSGFQRVVPAALILVLSWSFQRVCDGDHLNTAGFLMEIGQPRVTVEWMPLVAFCVVALTAFVVGNSWAALPLALPLFISVTNGYLADLNEADPMHPLLLATIGAVIAGTVFGHHCSPISVTTILSSASSSCSHLDHVFTQLPYALTVAAVAAIFGYAPVAYGYSPVILLPVGTMTLLAILLFGGRPTVPAEIAKTEAPPAEAQPAARGNAGDARGRPTPAKPVAAAAETR